MSKMSQPSINAPVFDLHCDAVLKLVHRGAKFCNDNPVSHVDIPKMRKGHVTGMIYSLWSDPVFKNELAVKRTQYMLDIAKKEISENANALHLCFFLEDLVASEAEEKISALLGIEGGISIHDSLQNLQNFYRQGVRRMTLTHTVSTNWAGSASDEGSNRGLSDFGKDVVWKMNDLGMIVDVAHTSEPTCLDTCKISKQPVFCTHSLAKKVFNSSRLATDEMIHAIGATGGIFGLAFFPAFFPNQDESVTKRWMEDIIQKLNAGGTGNTLEEQAHNNSAVFMDTPPPAAIANLLGILPHMDHVIGLIGEDHVGIGTDFDGMPFGPVGLEDCSKFENLRLLMRTHGYSDTRIQKILGGNVRRVMKMILPAH